MLKRKIAIVSIGLMFAGGAAAADFPTQPIKLVVPFAAGGGTDQWARLYALKLSDKLGVPIMVENRPGANTQIGANAVAKAEPDGHTLLFTSGTHIQLPALYSNLPYAIPDDFAPVGQVGTTGLIFVATPDIKVNNLQEFSAASKKAGDYSLGTYATGSAGDVFGRYFSEVENLRMPTIAYKGESQALIDVVAGRVQGGLFSVASVKPLVEGKKIKAIASLSASRSPSFPDVPTMVEQGYKDFNWPGVWLGVFAPAKTPPAVIERLATASKAVVEDPEVKKAYANTDLIANWKGPESFSHDIKQQMDVWGDLVKRLGVKVE